jgi:hypothetical protein
MQLDCIMKLLVIIHLKNYHPSNFQNTGNNFVICTDHLILL